MRLGFVYGLALFFLTTGCVKTIPAGLNNATTGSAETGKRIFGQNESTKARPAPASPSENGWLVSIPGVDTKILKETDQVTVTLRCKDGSQIETAASQDDLFQLDNNGIYILIREICPAIQFRVILPDFVTEWIDLPSANAQDDHDSHFSK